MREIGGYIELDTYTGEMLHEDGIKLNCGRNALAYLIKAKEIKKIYMPKFMCDSCDKILDDNKVEVVYYHIGLDFKPTLTKRDGWLYVVNFYGQLSNNYLSSLGDKIIVDNAQAYFQEPIPNVDTIYTCRKYFGVADGAILYTDKTIHINEQDKSYERMRFLLGRYEKSAEEFYADYVENNRLFKEQPIKRMSKLTENLLHGIDYNMIKERRTVNFMWLHKHLKDINRIKISNTEGTFMYPLYLEDGDEIRKKLQSKKIFIPILWPAVFNVCNYEELEYRMAKNILPIPIDQRYSIKEMKYIVEEINNV